MPREICHFSYVSLATFYCPSVDLHCSLGTDPEKEKSWDQAHVHTTLTKGDS